MHFALNNSVKSNQPEVMLPPRTRMSISVFPLTKPIKNFDFFSLDIPLWSMTFILEKRKFTYFLQLTIQNYFFRTVIIWSAPVWLQSSPWSELSGVLRRLVSTFKIISLQSQIMCCKMQRIALRFQLSWTYTLSIDLKQDFSRAFQDVRDLHYSSINKKKEGISWFKFISLYWDIDLTHTSSAARVKENPTHITVHFKFVLHI